MFRSVGSGRLRLRLVAIELAYDISANRPRRNLRGFRVLALAVGLLVDRADERAFDESRERPSCYSLIAEMETRRKNSNDRVIDSV
jgi:hypothetical protein